MPDTVTSTFRGLGAIAVSAALALCALADGTADNLVIARAAIADGLYVKAEQNLVRYLAANRHAPSHDEYRLAMSLYCQTLSAQKRFGDVIGLLDGNADILAHGDQRPFLYWRAHALVETGNAQGAIDVVKPDLQLASKTNDVATLNLLRVAAEAYSRFETPEANGKAERILEHIFDVSGKDAGGAAYAGSRLLYARLLTRDGRNAEAAAIFTELESSGDVADALRASALLDHMRISSDDAPRLLECARMLSSLSLGKASSLYAIPCGRMLASNTNTVTEGALLLEKAIRSDPTSPEAPDAQFMLAETWLAAGSNSLAVAAFKNFVETYNTTPERTAAAIAGEATALHNLKSYDEASTLFLKSSQTTGSPVVAALYAMRAADSMYAAGKYDTAAAVYAKAASCPQKGALEDIDERVFAAEDVGNAFAPSYVMWRSTFMFADCSERLGRIDESIGKYRELASIRESGELRDKALYRLAVLYERQEGNIGAMRSAVASYSELISSTTNAELKCAAMLGRGRSNYRLRSFRSALEDLDEVEKSAFDVAEEAALYRIYTLYGMGDDDAARGAALYIIKNSPDASIIPSVMFWLAQHCYNRRDFAEARKVFLDFARRFPTDGRAALSYLLAAKSAVKLSEYQSAVDALGSIGQNYPDSDVIPEARYMQAQALCSMARFEDAVLVLNDLMARFPSDAFATRSLILKGDALYSLYGSAENAGSITNAIGAYRTASARIDATVDMKLECACKVARCMEKGGDAAGAFDQYYDEVILPFRKLADAGDVSFAAKTVFSRATRAAAAILEQRGDIDRAINLLGHLVEMDAPERDQAVRDIARLRNL